MPFLFFFFPLLPLHLRAQSRLQSAAGSADSSHTRTSVVFHLVHSVTFFSLFRLHGDEMQKAAARLTFCEMQTADEIPVISGATNAKKKPREEDVNKHPSAGR